MELMQLQENNSAIVTCEEYGHRCIQLASLL